MGAWTAREKPASQLSCSRREGAEKRGDEGEALIKLGNLILCQGPLNSFLILMKYLANIKTFPVVEKVVKRYT